MFKWILINKLNKKYAGKELMFCEKIYEDISFLPFSIHKCCHCTRMPYSPPLLFPRIPKKFSFKDYIKKIDSIMDSNQKEVKTCQGCKFLKKQIVPKFPQKYIFKFRI